jgi:DNA-binding beta-propeller fold protein YncE
MLAGLFFAAAVFLPAFAADPDDQPVFFPSPPSEPKLQFLKKYSSALDVTTKNKGFRDFVFGGAEKEGSLVEKPYGAAIHDGALFIVDARGSGYAVFDLATNSARMVRPSGAAQLLKPINIAIDEDGTRYVTDTSRKQILVFDSDDRFQRAIGDPERYEPIDVAISGDKLIVTDIKDHQVHFLDKASGEILKTIGEKGNIPGTFFHPTNIAIGADGSIYIMDTTNVRIQQFTADGEFIREVGGQGNRPGKFVRPKGVAVDREGNIYVTDAAFQNIQVLAAEDGGALMAFGEVGSEPFNINMPTVVKIDYENVEYFRQYAAPGWEVEYLVIVANQYGPNKVVVFGFGHFSDE